MTTGASWALHLGRSAAGRWITIPLTNRGGIVVGGQPGSGKTAGLRSMLAPLMRSPLAQFAVVDGKGGSEWASMAPRAFACVPFSTDLELVVCLLRTLEEERVRRMSEMLRLRGSSNFWADGPSAALPLIVLVIDEIQTLLDPSYYPRSDKQAQALVAEAQGLVKRLSALSRAAGIVTALATQKPTADSIPTQSRDNATARLCFSVSSREAARAVLGDRSDAESADDVSSPSPIGLPQGVAVAALMGLGLVKVRVPFIPEQAVYDVACRTTELARSPVA